MKLDLKHLAAYLPYKVESRDHSNSIYRLELSIDNYYRFVGKYADKMILRPLLDLRKEIEVNGEKFVPKNILRDLIMERGNYTSYDSSWINENIDIQLLPYWMIEYLLEWHFDIHRLIEKGLAIDINTL